MGGRIQLKSKISKSLNKKKHTCNILILPTSSDQFTNSLIYTIIVDAVSHGYGSEDMYYPRSSLNGCKCTPHLPVNVQNYEFKDKCKL